MEEDSQTRIAIETDKIGDNLAEILKKKFNSNLIVSNVPLPFQCGFTCNCATCAVKFENTEIFEAICETTPPEMDELIALKMEEKIGKYW
jgi:ferredoxin